MKWYIAGTLVTGIMSVFITFLMTWNFDSKTIGVYGLISSTTAFLLLIFNLGLDQALVRNFSSAENKNNVLYNCLLPCLIFLILGCTIFLLNYNYFSNLVYGRSSLSFVVLASILIFLMLIQRFFLLVIRCDGRSKQFAISNILNKFIYLIYIISIILFSFDLGGFTLIYGLLIGLLICNVLLFRSVYKYLIFDDSIFFDKKYFKYAIPLLLSTCIIGLLGFLDKFLISKWYGLNDLGKYVIVYNTGLIFSYFTSLLNIIWMPFVFRNQEKNIVNFINRVLLLVGYGAIFFATSFFLIRDYLAFIFPENYNDLIKFIYFVIMNCIVYTWSEIPSSVILLENKSIYNFIAVMFNLILVVLCIPILKKYGFEYFFLIFFLGNVVSLISKIVIAGLINKHFLVKESIIIICFLITFSILYFFEKVGVWYAVILMIIFLALFFKKVFECYKDLKNGDYKT